MSEEKVEERPRIFVFGSNLAGIHGAGSAKFAEEKHGAIRGIGVGLWNNSYAIPTKGASTFEDKNGAVKMGIGEVLDLGTITNYVYQFLDFAESRPDLDFDVVPIGCGISGYKHEEIAPMFLDYPENVFFLDPEFEKAINKAEEDRERQEYKDWEEVALLEQQDKEFTAAKASCV